MFEFTDSGIAWPSDKNKYGKTKYGPGEAVPPPNWMADWKEYVSGGSNCDLGNDRIAHEAPG